MSIARPFLKWAGGKSQILPKLEARFPQALLSGRVKHYYEPFVGGGAVFLHVVQKYRIEEAYLSDINDELILVYRTIKCAVKELIRELDTLQSQYRSATEAGRRKLFYAIRDEYNEQRKSIDFSKATAAGTYRSAMAIFLNRTCFNGLFRVNRSGGFNVPFGRYENPTILDRENLAAVSELLKRVEVEVEPFDRILDKVKPASFVYFDPPYKPISKTSSFTAYSTFDFNDAAQIRLAEVFHGLSEKENVWVMLSNSDPGTDYFHRLYDHERDHIDRVQASRMINSVAARRGKISELVITNYLK